MTKCLVFPLFCKACCAACSRTAKPVTKLDASEIITRMMIMIMINNFCGMINLRTARSRSSSKDFRQEALPSQQALPSQRGGMDLNPGLLK